MHTVGAYKAKMHFSELLERVKGGEEITITKHGAPVDDNAPGVHPGSCYLGTTEADQA